MYNKFIAFILLGLFFGCQRLPNEYLIENSSSDKEIVSLEYVRDLVIPLDSIGSPIYNLFSLYTHGGDEFYIGHNERSFTLDLINLSKGKVIQSTSLNREGPDGIPSRISKMLVHNLDSIFVIQDQKMRIINIDGRILNEYETTIKGEDGSEIGFMINYNDASIHYDPREQAVYTHYFDYGIYNGVEKSLSHPIVLKFYLKNENFEFLPVYFSEFIQSKKGKVGERMPNLSYIGSKLIYGFPVESNIYSYDIKEGITASYGGKSRFSSNIELSQNDPEYNFRATETWFLHVQYDKQSGLYFRTHWGSQPKKIDEFTYSTAYSKPGYLIFFNENFEIIDEIELDSKYWVEESFTNSLGLFFTKKDLYVDNDLNLVFGVFKAVRK
ncbi:DUF4221 domain-containing protein [Belliella kenyensis]|uniref:DUF4221 domain-containing protein n=1 Tax=Belliella kenyensis TaxID=1472724 RepID=A0ABV8ERJ8_9BACT|nr:DUF4221 domain-containing protein [Belliella kenyensis]MCH7402536.1 DUF4221 domain-containing protein [Belliella kenyensis]MDN3603334.1 DUF4221 domain-containing protein [Belliella kenyensis]